MEYDKFEWLFNHLLETQDENTEKNTQIFTSIMQTQPELFCQYAMRTMTSPTLQCPTAVVIRKDISKHIQTNSFKLSSRETQQ